MQIALFLILILVLSALFLINRNKFVHSILILGGLPLVFLMPTLLIPISGNINVSGAFLLYLFLFSFIGAFIRFPTLIKIVRRNYLLALFILFSCISLLWSPSVGKGISMTVKYMVSLLFMTLLLTEISSYKDIIRFEKSIIWCGAILIVLGILNKLTGGLFDSFEGRVKWAKSMVLLAPYMSPANYSFMLGMAAIVSFSNYVFYKKNIWLFLYAIFFVGVLLAFTRISMAAVLLSSLILYGVMKRSLIITIIAPGVAFITAALAVVFIRPLRERMFFNGKSVDFSLILSDFDKFLTYIDTSGRTALWQGALKYYKNANTLIGSGSGSTDYWVTKYSTAGAIHSEFLRIYLDLGILGLIVFLIAFFMLIKTSCGKTKNKDNRAIHQKHKAQCVGGAVFYFVTLFTDNTLNYVNGFGIYLYAFLAFSLYFVYEKKSILTPPQKNDRQINEQHESYDEQQTQGIREIKGKYKRKTIALAT